MMKVLQIGRYPGSTEAKGPQNVHTTATVSAVNCYNISYHC